MVRAIVSPMGLTYLFILALVQGITEFLPISSSAHLVLLPAFIGHQDQGLLLDVAVHVGTLLAVLVYHWRDLLDMGLSVIDWRNPARRASRQLVKFLVIATIPTVLCGFLLYLFIPDGIRSLPVIAATTLVFGLLMWIADVKGGVEKEMSQMTFKSALYIGLAQILALIPGTSRSGITITAARFLGFNRVDAARFSFLLSIPTIAGAGVIGACGLAETGDISLWREAILAAALSFVSALVVIHLMIKWLKSFSLLPFVIYRLVLGGVLVALMLSGFHI